MATEVGSLVLFPTPIFPFNSVQKPVFTAEIPWFLAYCLLIDNLIRLTSAVESKIIPRGEASL